MEIAVRILFLLGGLTLLAVWRKTGETPGGYVLFKHLSLKARVAVTLAIVVGGLQFVGVGVGTFYMPFERVLGLLIFCGGIALGAWGKLTLGPNWDPSEDSRPLVTWGAYDLCRHPIYLGGYLAAVGAEIALGSILALLAIPGLFVLRAAAISEEEMLIAHFGEEYRDYRRRVRRFVIF